MCTLLGFLMEIGGAFRISYCARVMLSSFLFDSNREDRYLIINFFYFIRNNILLILQFIGKSLIEISEFFG